MKNINEMECLSLYNCGNRFPESETLYGPFFSMRDPWVRPFIEFMVGRAGRYQVWAGASRSV